MTSQINTQRWVLASNNRGKLAEFQRLFAERDIEVVPQAELAVTEIPETGLSFIENALLKARNAAAQTSLPALADDSGLEVTSLGGEPGIYSARYAAGDSDNDGNASDQANNAKLLMRLEGSEQRDARFVCALAFVRHQADPTPVVAVGYWQGRIIEEARGAAGFGYDPLFFVASEGCTAAELSPERKAELSHRGQAMQRLFAMLVEENVFTTPA